MAAKSKKIPSSKIDEQIEESFPASDPPAFTAGQIGAPKRRKKAKKKPVKKIRPAKKALRKKR